MQKDSGEQKEITQTRIKGGSLPPTNRGIEHMQKTPANFETIHQPMDQASTQKFNYYF